jgi:hypothetical protein
MMDDQELKHDGLDVALFSLADRSDDPWLATRVEAELAARAEARQWLKSHPQGLLGLKSLLTSGGSLTGQGVVQTALILMAAGCGASAVALPALAAHVPAPLGPMFATAIASALAAAAALRWPEMRGLFSG